MTKLARLEGRLTLHKAGNEDKFVGITEGDLAALVRVARAAEEVADPRKMTSAIASGRMGDLQRALAPLQGDDD